VRVSPRDVEDLRIGAFWTGAAAFLMAIPSLLMGATAASLVREAQGALKGKGIAQAAVFLAILGAAIPVVGVKPRLAQVEHSRRDAHEVALQFVQHLRAQKFDEARAAISESIRDQFSEANLQFFAGEIQKRQARWMAPKTYVSEGGAQVRVRWVEGDHDRFMEVTLRRDTRWRVSEVKFSPSK